MGRKQKVDLKSLSIYLKSISIDWKLVLPIIIAIVGVIMAHVLTIKRERSKFYLECFQNFISPAYFRTLRFLTVKGLPYKFIKDGNTSKDLYDDILGFMENNIKYAPPNVINKLAAVKLNLSLHFTQIDSNSPYLQAVKSDEIALCLVVLKEYKKYCKRIKILNKQTRKDITLLQGLCVMWFFLFTGTNINTADLVFKHKDLIIKNINLKRLSRKSKKFLRNKVIIFQYGDYKKFIEKEIIKKLPAKEALEFQENIN